MKKLLSAVTSFVMSATLMTSAFASPVSAAGGISTVQPTVSLGEVSDVSANKNASNANLIIDFGEYTAKPGDKVVVKPTIKNNGGEYPLAGVDVEFAIDSPLKITAIGGSSAAFGGAAVSANLDQYKASITPLNGNGDPTVATDGEALFQLMVQIPESAAGGTYDIGFGNKVDLFKEGASSDEWSFKEITGKITVEGSGNITTTPPSDGNANLIIDFGNYEANAGDKVVVKPTIKNNGGEYPLAGVDVEFKLDDPLTITAIGGSSAAFGGAAVSTNLDQYKASITPLDGNGDPTVAADGEALFQLMVQIPANCPDGTYEIGFGNKVDLFKEGASSDEWSYQEITGTITVGEGGSVTTTTTTTKQPTGDANLIIDFGNYESEAGEKVVVKPTIKNNGGKYPLAGVDVEFAIDDPLTITAIGGSSAAFGGAAVSTNLEQYKASITPLDGNGDPTVATDGEALFQLMVQIPADCPDGTYEIGFGDKVDLFKEGASSDEWSYQEITGTITVGKPSTPSNGSLVIDFGKYSAQAGETIEVAPTIKSVDDECAIGGIDVQLAIDNPLEITAIGGTSPAFGGASVNSNILDLYASVITLDANGEPSVPTDGEALFKIMVDIPAGTPAGTYEIGFGNRVEIFKQGKNSDMWPYEEIKGTITVYGDSTTSTTTTTTTTVPPVAGSVEWVIPTVNALPGETVTMDVVVKNSDIEVAGAQFDINAKSPIDYSASSGSTAYDSTLVANGATKQFAFGQGIGKGIKAENGSTVLTLTYKVPADCAAGSYPVEWSNAFISDTNGNDITNKVTLTDGAIIVGVTGEVSWVLDNVTAKPGDEVTLKAVISDPKATKLPIAGAQFNINAKAPIVYSAIAGSDAYGATIVNNDAIKAFAFAEGVGAGVASEDGKVVLTITYKVPADCPAGVYPVEWSNAFISDTNGGSLTDKVSLIDGSITVEDEETEGDVTWNIPEVEAMPGQTVTMNVLVEGSSDPALEVAGAQFSINADSPIIYEAITGSEAYGANIVANNADKKFAFAEGIGSGVAAADGAVVLVLTYTVPEDCAEGEYPVKWSNAFISDTNGKDITGKVNLDDGAIIVKKTTTTTTTDVTTTTSVEGSTTTTSSTSTTSTSTSTTTLPEGAVLWKIDTVEAKPGETVTLNMVVLDPNGTKLPIAGAQFDINADAPIVYGGVTEKSDAYGATIVVNPATKEFAFADGVGAGVPSEDGKYVLTLTYTVPEDCAAGTYPVKISDLFVSTTDGADITKNVLTENGAIIVKVPTTTTTTSGSTTTTTSGSTTTTTSGSTTTTTSGSTTTTTSTTTSTTSTTSTTLPEGAILWKIDTVEAKPGETVTLNMVVVDSNGTKLPISAAQFNINADSPIKYVGVSEISDAYGAAIVANAATNEFAFADKDGNAIPSENGKYVLTLTYTVPEDCAAGTYPVKISELFASTVDGAEITDRVLTENGAIIVKVPTTTSTVTTSTVTTTSEGSTTTTTSGSTTTTTSGSTTSTTSGSTTTTTSGSTTSTTSSSTSTTSTTSSSTTSTTTTTIPVSGVIWQVESVTAEQGDTVKVPVKLIDFYNNKLPVSGAQFTIDFDTDKFELVGASDKSGAYLADIVYNPATGQYAFANGTGNAVIGTDGADVIVLEFKVKDTCPNGTYDIAIEDLFVSDANGGDITALVVTVPGKITVDGSGTGPWTADTFAIVEKTHGFYFSHDNGTRNNGEKGGFNPGQITSLKIYNKVTQDGITVDSEWAAEDVDMSEINFGDAVPSTVYDEANTTFKYEVPVYYGKTPMVDRDGNQITVTVYIGVKGDIDLNNKVLANDAAQALAFYTASQAIGADPAKIQLSESPYVTGADDVLDDFCAFLGDVDVNEWSESNWKLTKADRKMLANDAGAILTFYSESQTPGAEAQALWDEIVPERYGEIA